MVLINGKFFVVYNTESCNFNDIIIIKMIIIIDICSYICWNENHNFQYKNCRIFD